MLTSFPPDLQTPLPIPMGGAFCLSGHSSGLRVTPQDAKGIPMALPAFAILFFWDGFGLLLLWIILVAAISG
jgi:hypothetical protein